MTWSRTCIARRHADLGVAEDLHYHALVDALGQQQGGNGVPGIMKPRITDVDRFEHGFPFTPISPRIDRAAIGLAPYEIIVLPRGPGRHPLRELSRTMQPEGSDQRRGNGDHAAALGRLEFGQYEASTYSPRTRARMPSAVR
jgi:hypothetical protein